MWFSQLPRHGQAKPGALPAALRLVASVVAAAGSRFGPGVQATLTRTKGGPGAGQMVEPKTEHPNREKLFAEIVIIPCKWDIPWETITWIKWIQFGWPRLRPQKQIPLRIPCQESCIPELPRMSGVSWYTLSMVRTVSRWKTVSERNFNSSGNRISEWNKQPSSDQCFIALNLAWNSTYSQIPETVSSIPETKKCSFFSPQQQPWFFTLIRSTALMRPAAVSWPKHGTKYSRALGPALNILGAKAGISGGQWGNIDCGRSAWKRTQPSKP